METTKHKCELCSMDATHLKQDESGTSHYYCEHHAPTGATQLGGVIVNKESPIKKFLPIIVIFSSIIIFTISALVVRGSWSTTFAMQMMMGSFFAIFGGFKVFNLRAFANAYADYDILAKRSRAYAFVYPFIEIALAVLYLADIGGIYRDIFTFLLMAVSSVGVIQKLRLKEEVPCACLGMVFKIPMTWITLIEDVLMALEAFFMAVMTFGLPLIYLDNTATLMQTLKIHTTDEWVQYSALGHWIIGGFIALVFLTSVLERFKVLWGIIFSKYISPIVLIVLGLALSIVDAIYHAIYNPDAVWYLLTHISQFGQHFWIGILLLVAGVAEWVRTHKNKKMLSFVVPIVIFLVGTIFFFHQQLGVVSSVRESMNWHMFFGAMLVIGATFRVLDILFFEEKKGFFVLWIVAVLIGSGMMATYHETEGSYQLLNKSGSANSF